MNPFDQVEPKPEPEDEELKSKEVEQNQKENLVEGVFEFEVESPNQSPVDKDKALNEDESRGTML